MNGGDIKILHANDFYMEGHHDLDYWPCYPQNNWDHLDIMTNLTSKFGEPRSKHSPDIARKYFFTLEVTATLTFDLVTPQNIGVF